MKTEQIIILVVAFFLGMLLLNMVKNVCGCDVVEGYKEVIGALPNAGVGGRCSDNMSLSRCSDDILNCNDCWSDEESPSGSIAHKCNSLYLQDLPPQEPGQTYATPFFCADYQENGMPAPGNFDRGSFADIQKEWCGEAVTSQVCDAAGGGGGDVAPHSNAGDSCRLYWGRGGSACTATEGIQGAGETKCGTMGAVGQQSCADACCPSQAKLLRPTGPAGGAAAGGMCGMGTTGCSKGLSCKLARDYENAATGQTCQGTAFSVVPPPKNPVKRDIKAEFARYLEEYEEDVPDRARDPGGYEAACEYNFTNVFAPNLNAWCCGDNRDECLNGLPQECDANCAQIWESFSAQCHDYALGVIPDTVRSLEDKCPAGPQPANPQPAKPKQARKPATAATSAKTAVELAGYPSCSAYLGDIMTDLDTVCCGPGGAECTDGKPNKCTTGCAEIWDPFEKVCVDWINDVAPELVDFGGVCQRELTEACINTGTGCPGQRASTTPEPTCTNFAPDADCNNAITWTHGEICNAHADGYLGQCNKACQEAINNNQMNGWQGRPTGCPGH